MAKRVDRERGQRKKEAEPGVRGWEGSREGSRRGQGDREAES